MNPKWLRLNWFNSMHKVEYAINGESSIRNQLYLI